MFKGRGGILAPSLIKSISNLLPWRKNLSNQGNMCCCSVVNFETFQSKIAHAVTKLNRMDVGPKYSFLTPKKVQSPQVQMRTVFVVLI